MINPFYKFFFDGFGYRLIIKLIKMISLINYRREKRVRNLIVKSTLNNFKFYTDTEDPKKFKFPTQLMRYWGLYEPLTSVILEKYVQENYNVLELGSAYGYFTIQLSKLSKRGTIYAVEPNTDYYENYLTKNIEINKLNNVKLFCTAIGDEKIIDVKGKSLKTISFKDFHNKNIDKDLDFIFIDVDARDEEGNIIRNEIIILRQIFKYYKKLKKPKIFLETKDLDKIYEDIKANNYEIKTITRRHFILLPMIN
jgi:predicted O-methyltransferase YrrM